MKRRTFVKKSVLGAIGFTLPIAYKNTTHILTLSFDDGFKKSFYQVAKIHEEYGLKACLNVIATGHHQDFNAEPQWIPREILGDFNDWNKLKEKGHEIMPHTWDHSDATKTPVNQAKEDIDRCLEYFEKNLDGYRSNDAVYNYAYNASTPELDAYALKKVKAVRTGGWLVLNGKKVNPMPNQYSNKALGCYGHGPSFCDDYVEMEINNFLESEGGWLIINTHGLDKEGWGPLSSSYLDRLLQRLIKIDKLKVLPTAEVLNMT